jgi:hypothetical protein
VLNAAPRGQLRKHTLFSFRIALLTRAAVDKARVANHWKQEIEVIDDMDSQ